MEDSAEMIWKRGSEHIGGHVVQSSSPRTDMALTLSAPPPRPSHRRTTKKATRSACCPASTASTCSVWTNGSAPGGDPEPHLCT